MLYGINDFITFIIGEVIEVAIVEQIMNHNYDHLSFEKKKVINYVQYISLVCADNISNSHIVLTLESSEIHQN